MSHLVSYTAVVFGGETEKTEGKKMSGLFITRIYPF